MFIYSELDDCNNKKALCFSVVLFCLLLVSLNDCEWIISENQTSSQNETIVWSFGDHLSDNDSEVWVYRSILTEELTLTWMTALRVFSRLLRSSPAGRRLQSALCYLAFASSWCIRAVRELSIHKSAPVDLCDSRQRAPCSGAGGGLPAGVTQPGWEPVAERPAHSGLCGIHCIELSFQSVIDNEFFLK